MGDEMGRRELCLPLGSGGYVLRYVITADEIVVIRAWHSREERSWCEQLPDKIQPLE